MAQRRGGLYKRGPFWWIRTDPVTGKARSTKCSDLEAARRFFAVRERIAADPSHAAAETARLDEWIRRVIAAKERAGKSAATIEVYRTKLGHWLRLAPGAMLAQVTPEFVDAFVEQRRREDVSDHTISKEVSHLLTVLRAAKRARAYAGDLETLRPADLHAGYKPRKRALSRQEVQRLLAELAPELGALVAVCIALGCRLSEAQKLLPSDVELSLGRVHIGGTKTEEADRFVPVLSVYRGLLAAALPYLPLAPRNNICRDLAAACRRAGIEPCTPNDLRRTHATLLSEAGVDRDVTRRLLGHTTTNLVDRVYGQPSTAALAELAESSIARAGAEPVISSENHDPAGVALRECYIRDESREIQFVDPAGKVGADFEIRTRDLRFTKPDPYTGQAWASADERRFPGLSKCELERSRATGETRALQRFAALDLAESASRSLLVAAPAGAGA